MPTTSQFTNQTGQSTGQQTVSAFDPSSTAQSNLNAIPNLANLTSLINSINQSAQTTANQSRVPGGAGLEQQSSANISNALQGKLPPDVLALLGQQGAERGISTGAPGSPNSGAALMRALGLSSLDLQNTGQGWLSAATARNPIAPLFDMTHFLNTPSQAGTTTTSSGTTQNSGNTTSNYPEQPAPAFPGAGGGNVMNPIRDNSWIDSLFNPAPSRSSQGFSFSAPATVSPNNWAPGFTGEDWNNLFEDPSAGGSAYTPPDLGSLVGPIAPGWSDNAANTYDPFSDYNSSFYDEYQ